MDQNLAFVEGREVARLWIAESDDAEQLVVDRVVTETVFENCSAA